MVSLAHMFKVTGIIWLCFQGQIIKEICGVFIFFYSRDQSCTSHLKNFLPMWWDQFCLALACDLQLMIELLSVLKPQFNCVLLQSGCTSAALNNLLHTDGSLRGTSRRLVGEASSHMLIPLEQTTQTLCIISFLWKCYLVNQCRLLVTVFPFNFINNSFFCCLGSPVWQTKLQHCQACWWPTVMLAEHFALFWCPSGVSGFTKNDLLLHLSRCLCCKFSRSVDLKKKILSQCVLI